MAQLYTDLMPTDSKITFEIANSLWQREGFPVYGVYKNNISQWFKGDITELNFDDPQAVTIINNWIADKTHDKIKNMLSAISDQTVLFLINAIYFKGDWKYKFDKQYTIDMPFTTVNGENVNTPFMNAKPHIKYFKNESGTIISLPYADSAYTMLLLLPDYNLGMDGFMQQITTENIKNWQSQMTYEDVDVSLPKFKFTNGNREISPELKSMGLTDAFNPDIADFSNITPEQIFISLVLHKAFIEVNEEGSEAAAATIIGFDNTSVGPQEPEFIATRPFIFAICHQPTNTILFIGKVANPSL
jgi:serine protease inhibitor